MELGENYWTKRYEEHHTPWDAGGITAPLKEYFDQVKNKAIKILIPGGGNGHEAAYLYKNGFSNVYLVDISEVPLKNFKSSNPYFPAQHILHRDFFELDEKFDLIVEQTFFCAIDRSQRRQYAKKAYELLNDGGRLVGLFFNDMLNNDFPPFGGDREEYLEYFSPLFEIAKFEVAYNSIKPRAGREFFINLRKVKI